MNPLKSKHYNLNPRTFVSKYKIALPTTKELEELVKEDLEELT